MTYTMLNTNKGKYRHTNGNDSVYEIDEDGKEKLIGAGMQMGFKHGQSYETKCHLVEAFKAKKAARA